MTSNDKIVDSNVGNSSDFSPRLHGECKWTIFNTGMAIFLGLTLILNLITAFIIFRVPLITNRGRSNPVYLCIRFLNVVDMTQALLLLVMPAFADDDCTWKGGPMSCKGWGFVALFLLLVSPLITIMMGLDRVMALYQPFKYKSNLGLQALKLLLPAACVIACMITALPLAGVGEYHVVKGRRMCLLDTIVDDPVDQIFAIMVHALFFLALLFMVGCTAIFQVKLCSLSSNKKFSSRSSGRRTRNATITTMAICSIFVACYSPYVIRVLIEASTLSKSPVWITWFTFGLAFLQPLLNPIVYLGTNSKYRNELRAIMQRVKQTEGMTSSDSLTATTSRAPIFDSRRRSSNFGHRRSSKQTNCLKLEKQISLLELANNTSTTVEGNLRLKQIKNESTKKEGIGNGHQHQLEAKK